MFSIPAIELLMSFNSAFVDLLSSLVTLMMSLPSLSRLVHDSIAAPLRVTSTLHLGVFSSVHEATNSPPIFISLLPMIRVAQPNTFTVCLMIVIEGADTAVGFGIGSSLLLHEQNVPKAIMATTSEKIVFTTQSVMSCLVFALFQCIVSSVFF